MSKDIIKYKKPSQAVAKAEDKPAKALVLPEKCKQKWWRSAKIAPPEYTAALEESNRLHRLKEAEDRARIAEANAKANKHEADAELYELRTNNIALHNGKDPWRLP